MVRNSIEFILKIICLSHPIHGCKFDFQLKMSINLTKYRQMLERKSRWDSNWPGMYLSHSLPIVWIQKTVARSELKKKTN